MKNTAHGRGWGRGHQPEEEGRGGGSGHSSGSSGGNLLPNYGKASRTLYCYAYASHVCINQIQWYSFLYRFWRHPEISICTNRILQSSNSTKICTARKCEFSKKVGNSYWKQDLAWRPAVLFYSRLTREAKSLWGCLTHAFSSHMLGCIAGFQEVC